MGLFDLFTGVEADYKHIDSAELLGEIEKLGKEKISIIDVRTSGEFANGHIPGALNINVMGPNFVEQLNGLEKSKTYYIICASGNRSKTACGIMRKRGFQDITNVKGGMMSWQGEVE